MSQCEPNHPGRLAKMMRWMGAAFCVAVMAFGAMQPRAEAVSADEATDAHVRDMIERIQATLLEMQDDDGRWNDEGPSHTGGTGQTALVVAALLYSGVSPQEPEVAKAMQVLADLETEEEEFELEKTYQVGLHAHVWAAVHDDLAEPINDVFYWLSTNYDPETTTIHYDGDQRSGDHSNTQYHLLGLWECAKRGIPIEGEFWEKSISHWIESQDDNGRWGYTPTNHGRHSDTMTLAGLTALLIGQQEHLRDRQRADREVAAAINQGLAWTDDDFSSYRGTHQTGDGGYHLMSIERVALASGRKYFGDRDWFRMGVEHVADNVDGWENNQPSGRISDMALSLIFLAHGHVPVWATKLEVPGISWNERPNDLYFLSRHISDFREGDVTFYTMSIEHPAEDLIATPVAYISSREDLDLTAEQKANLRRYLDLGGMLVANPEQGSSAFASSVDQLGRELYPQLEWERADAEHPIFNTLFEVNPQQHNVEVLNNGVRDLIVLPQGQNDWGYAWQADERFLESIGEGRRGDVAKLTMNLFAMATNRGALPNRLEGEMEQRDEDVDETGTVRIGLARPGGGRIIEPAAWDVAGIHLFNRTGVDVELTGAPDDEGESNGSLSLSQITDHDLDLVHVAGIDETSLSSAEIEAIERFVEDGGTVLIETLGGHGDFARDLEQQLRDSFGRRALPVGAEDALLSGEADGGYDVTRINYRRYTAYRLDYPPQPRLRAMHVDDRPAVIFSDEDLSLGALGVRRWGIIGYAADDARRLMTNIALQVKQ